MRLSTAPLAAGAALLPFLPTVFSLPLSPPSPLRQRSPIVGSLNRVTNPSMSDYYSASLTTGAAPPVSPASHYTCLDGHISALSSWPTARDWVSFDAMWTLNLPAILLSTPSPAAQQLRDAITGTAAAAHIDARLVLAIVMQESTGNVYAPCNTDAAGHTHCGVMQGPPVREPYAPGPASLHQMLADGVYGVGADRAPGGRDFPGLSQYLQGGKGDVSWVPEEHMGNPYLAARLYNSGEVRDGNVNVSPWDPKTMGYANDVAMRLTGWDGGVEGCRKSAEVCGMRDVADCTR